MFAQVATPKLHTSYNLYVYRLCDGTHRADTVMNAEKYFKFTLAAKFNLNQASIFNRVYRLFIIKSYREFLCAVIR